MSGMTPNSSKNASVFTPAEGVSGPEMLAARARTLGFVAGNMFGAASTNFGLESDDLLLQRANGFEERRASSLQASEQGTINGAGGHGLSYIGSLGASISRHEAYSPYAERALYSSSGPSEKASQQFRAGLGVAPAAAPRSSTTSVNMLRPPPHVSFPQGLLLPSTSAAPHVSLHTLAEREHDIMGRWPSTMAAAAEMQLKAHHHTAT